MRDYFIKQAWRRLAGYPEEEYTEPERIDLNALKKSEWSEEFEKLMRNRLIMGAFRYGKMVHDSEELKKKPPYNRVASIEKRLKLYSETGNKEYLVDCANLCLLEFVECRHPNAHFEVIDNTTEHVTV